MINLGRVVGTSAFALAQYPRDHIIQFIEHVQSRGYNMIRVLSETGGWREFNVPWLPAGPDACTKEARKQLKRLLEVASDLGIDVELVISGTIREKPLNFQMRWARQVIKKALPYGNVIISVMNEAHQSSLTYAELNKMLDLVRAAGLPAGLDWRAEEGWWSFPLTLRPHCDWIGFHPRRNPNLTLKEIRNIINRNDLALFDETTCYITDIEIHNYNLHMPNSLYYLEGLGTQKQRRDSAREYKRRYAKVKKARWFFHSLEGIHCKNPLMWMPRWS